jgi:hypothetical protein
MSKNELKLLLMDLCAEFQDEAAEQLGKANTLTNKGNYTASKRHAATGETMFSFAVVLRKFAAKI